MVKTATSPLDSIDDDIRAACADRADAWRKLVIRDDQPNRDAYAEASAEVDGLLEMRYEMVSGEG